MSFLKNTFSFFKEVIQEYTKDEAFEKGAALSYYTVFSIAPMLVIIISIAGLVLGEEAVEGQIYSKLESIIGHSTAEQIQQIIANIHSSGSGAIATVISIGTLLLGATAVMNQLKRSLNKIWEMKEKPGQGILATVFSRLVSLSMVIGLGFILLVALVLDGAAAAFGSYLTSFLPKIGVLLIKFFNFLLSLAVTTVVFAAIFRFLPDAEIRWRDVWKGAIFTAILFVIGEFALGFYLSNSNMGETYGAAGAIIILMVWVYYSAQLLFVGAEFTYVYAKRHGNKIIPNKRAVKIKYKKPEEEPSPYRQD